MEHAVEGIVCHQSWAGETEFELLPDPAEAVPKRILDQMDVEGLTRENVASHLQVGPLLTSSIITE